jgi:hypothetical protein
MLHLVGNISKRTEMLTKQWSEKCHLKKPLGRTRYRWKDNITVDSIIYELD